MKNTKLLHVLAGFLCVAGPAMGQGTQSTFDGEWEIIYPCTGATGPYIDRCEEGMRDVFNLRLTQQGQLVCGYHLVTGHLGNRVDEGDLGPPGPSINGTASGNVATLNYRSARTGEVGQATLTRKGNTVVWHALRPLNDDNWFPDDAVLRKKKPRSRSSPKPMNCEPVPSRQ